MSKYLVLLALNACSTLGVTKYGIRFSAPANISAQDIDDVIEETKATFEEVTGLYVPDLALRSIDDIIFVYHPLICTDGYCLGLTYAPERKMMIVLNSQCVAATSLAHEWIHVFARWANIGDSLHRNPVLFNRPARGAAEGVEYDSSKSVEGIAKRKVMEKLCDKQ